MEAVTFGVEGGLATVRMRREHGNAINGDLLDGLEVAFRWAADDPRVRGVLLAAGGKLFCPGLDLHDLAALDRPSMARFMARFSGTIFAMHTFPKPVVAAIGGHALAGGCLLTLTADWRVLRNGALVGLNEIKVGVPLPFAVTHLLRDSVHRPRLEEVALLGRNYSGREAVRTGLVHEILEDDRFEEHCLERLEEFASKDLSAFGHTKRYLRSATAELMRAEDGRHADEFLDCWFSPETRTRIEQIVADLGARSG